MRSKNYFAEIMADVLSFWHDVDTHLKCFNGKSHISWLWTDAVHFISNTWLFITLLMIKNVGRVYLFCLSTQS